MAVNHAVVRAPGAPKPGKKYFTVEEANLALPYVSRIVDDVTATYRRIVRLRRQLENAPAAIGAAEMEREYDQSMDRLSGYIDELHDVGVELKDFEQGLIDFPSLFEAIRSAPTIAAAELIPTRYPSSRARRRAISQLSSVLMAMSRSANRSS